MLWLLIFVQVTTAYTAEAYVVSKHEDMIKCFDAREQFYEKVPNMPQSKMICLQINKRKI